MDNSRFLKTNIGASAFSGQVSLPTEESRRQPPPSAGEYRAFVNQQNNVQSPFDCYAWLQQQHNDGQSYEAPAGLMDYDQASVYETNHSSLPSNEAIGQQADDPQALFAAFTHQQDSLLNPFDYSSQVEQNNTQALSHDHFTENTTTPIVKLTQAK